MSVDLPQRHQRHILQIGMPTSQALRKLMDGGLLTLLFSRPLLQVISLYFKMDLYCAYH